MSYHIYKTEGIVLGGVAMGESNRFLFLFTKDLGLVGAAAQGVRELKSKLRYSLQDLSHSRVDLVRGRNMWRVVNAEPICVRTRAGRKARFSSLCNLDARKTAMRVASLLRRLCAGEEKSAGLFEEVAAGFSFLNDEPLRMSELRLFETIMAIKILHHLGYWGERKEFAPFTKRFVWGKSMLGAMRQHAPAATRAINDALRESHL